MTGDSAKVESEEQQDGGSGLVGTCDHCGEPADATLGGEHILKCSEAEATIQATVVDGEPALEIGDRTVMLKTFLKTADGVTETNVEIVTDDQTWWEVRSEDDDTPRFEILLKEVDPE